VQAKLGLNKFFDLTVDEFTSMYTGTLPEADDHRRRQPRQWQHVQVQQAAACPR